MSAVSLRLPESLHRRIRELAQAEGISINSLITSALIEKMSALRAEEYLATRAKRGSRARFDAVLAKVRDRPPAPEDRLDQPPPESAESVPSSPRRRANSTAARRKK